MGLGALKKYVKRIDQFFRRARRYGYTTKEYDMSSLTEENEIKTERFSLIIFEYEFSYFFSFLTLAIMIRTKILDQKSNKAKNPTFFWLHLLD